MQFASYFFYGLIFHFTIVPAEIHIVSADFLSLRTNLKITLEM